MTNQELPKRKQPRLSVDLYASASRAYFLTVCTDNKQRLFGNSALARAVIARLIKEATDSGILIFAYCLMPDHLHILCAPSEDGRSVIDFIRVLKSKSTRLCWEYGIEGKAWQRGYYDHIVRREENLSKIAEYILDNPVRKALVASRDDFVFGGMPDPLPGWW